MQENGVSSFTRGQTALLGGIFLLALAVRIAFVWTHPSTLDFPDERSYNGVALNFMDGRGFILSDRLQVHRTPGYPLLLSAVYAMAGRENFLAVGLVQAIAGALTVLVAAWLALRLFSPAAGLFAAAVAAIYPFDVYLTPLILTETVFTLLLTALALSWVQWVRPDCAGKKWRAALAGFLSGVTIMVKPSILPLVGLVAIAAALCMRPRKTAVVSAVIMLFFTGAFLVPWAARNYRLTGHPVLTTLWTGKSLYEAVGPQADGGPAMDKIKLAEPYLNEYDFNEYYLQKSREEMRSDPARMLRLAGAKFLRFWNIFPNSPQYRTGLFKAASAAFMLPLLILGVAGVFRNRGSLGILWPVLAPLVFFTLLHMVFVGSVRYRAPVMPCVMALAAGSLWPRKGKS